MIGKKSMYSTKNLIDIRLKANENRYINKYWGNVIITFLFDLKVYSLLNMNPKKTPAINPIAEAIK